MKRIFISTIFRTTFIEKVLKSADKLKMLTTKFSWILLSKGLPNDYMQNCQNEKVCFKKSLVVNINILPFDLKTVLIHPDIMNSELDVDLLFYEKLLSTFAKMNTSSSITYTREDCESNKQNLSDFRKEFQVFLVDNNLSVNEVMENES